MKLDATVALFGGLAGPVVGMGVGMDEATQKVVLYGFAGVISSLFVSRSLAALNKLADLPTKAEWDSLRHTVDECNSKLSTHLAGYGEWKQSMEHRMSGVEDNVK